MSGMWDKMVARCRFQTAEEKVPASEWGNGTMESNIWIGFIVVVITIVGSHTWLHRDIAELRERMAKLEGTFEGFMTSQRKSAD